MIWDTLDQAFLTCCTILQYVRNADPTGLKAELHAPCAMMLLPHDWREEEYKPTLMMLTSYLVKDVAAVEKVLASAAGEQLSAQEVEQTYQRVTPLKICHCKYKRAIQAKDPQSAVELGTLGCALDTIMRRLPYQVVAAELSQRMHPNTHNCNTLFLANITHDSQGVSEEASCTASEGDSDCSAETTFYEPPGP